MQWVREDTELSRFNEEANRSQATRRNVLLDEVSESPISDHSSQKEDYGRGTLQGGMGMVETPARGVQFNVGATSYSPSERLKESGVTCSVDPDSIPPEVMRLAEETGIRIQAQDMDRGKGGTITTGNLLPNT